MKLIVTYLLALVLVSSCSTGKSDDSTLFIGTYRIIDQMVPYPYIVKQSKDSMFLFNNKGVMLEKIFNNKIEKHDTIDFNQKQLKILNKNSEGMYVFDLLDTLNFKPLKNGKPNPKNCAKFNQIQSNRDVDVERLRIDLNNTIWKHDIVADENSNPNQDLITRQTIQFKKDSLFVLTDYYYQGLKMVSEYEVKSYTFFKIDDLCFLSFQKKNDNPQPIFQIIDYDSGIIKLLDFSSREVKEISFQKTSIIREDFQELIKQTTYYSNCFDGYQGEYYIGDDVTFSKGNEYLIENIKRDAPTNNTKSGYIIVHFNINCQGNVGRFGLIQMDRYFKEILFSKELVSHIINKVSNLNDFPSSYSQIKWLEYKDVHAFLMFKLQNGKIVDLCP